MVPGGQSVSAVREEVEPQLTCFTVATPPLRGQEDLVDRDSSLTSKVTGAEPSRCRSSWRESVFGSEI